MTPTFGLIPNWAGCRRPAPTGCPARFATVRTRPAIRADRDYAQTPPPGVRRILAYGDSFTYCGENDIDDCWTRKLEKLPRTEVLNFGGPGYGTDQAWLRYQRGGASWRPCAVTIGVMLENINRVVNRFRPFYYAGIGTIPLPKPRFLLNGDQLDLLPNPARTVDPLYDPIWIETNLGPHDSWYFPGTFVGNPFDWLDLVRVTRTALYRRDRTEGEDWTPAWARRMYQPGNEGFEVLIRIISGFVDQARRDGATPVVLIFPTAGEIEGERDGAERPYLALPNALRERGIVAIDLTGPLGAEARRVGLKDLVKKHYPAGRQRAGRPLPGQQLPPLIAGTCGSP